MTDTTDLARLRERYIRTGSYDDLRAYVDAVSNLLDLTGPERARLAASVRESRTTNLGQPTPEELDRIWADVVGGPIDDEPDDDIDDDVSQFYDRASGSALRGLASAFVVMIGFVFLVIAFRSGLALGGIVAGILAAGCAFTLVGIGRGGDRG